MIIYRSAALRMAEEKEEDVVVHVIVPLGTLS